MPVSFQRMSVTTLYVCFPLAFIAMFRPELHCLPHSAYRHLDGVDVQIRSTSYGEIAAGTTGLGHPPEFPTKLLGHLAADPDTPLFLCELSGETNVDLGAKIVNFANSRGRVDFALCSLTDTQSVAVGYTKKGSLVDDLCLDFTNFCTPLIGRNTRGKRYFLSNPDFTSRFSKATVWSLCVVFCGFFRMPAVRHMVRALYLIILGVSEKEPYHARLRDFGFCSLIAQPPQSCFAEVFTVLVRGNANDRPENEVVRRRVVVHPIVWRILGHCCEVILPNIGFIQGFPARRVIELCSLLGVGTEELEAGVFFKPTYRGTAASCDELSNLDFLAGPVTKPFSRHYTGWYQRVFFNIMGDVVSSVNLCRCFVTWAYLPSLSPYELCERVFGSSIPRGNDSFLPAGLVLVRL